MNASNQLIIEELNHILQVDIDAVSAYKEALKHIEDKEIHAIISNFCNHHLQHIEDFYRLISNLGGTPIQMAEDFTGYLIEGFTSLMSISGYKGALSAMKANEIIINQMYKNVIVKSTMPEEVNNLLEKNYADEQIHLEQIQNLINAA